MKAALRQWLLRLLGAAPPHSTPAAPVADRRAPKPPAADDPLATAELAAINARRPLIAASGAVVGFEFRISDDVARYLKRQSDAHLRAARVQALLASAYAIGKTGRIGFARMPVQWLAHAANVEEVGPGVMIGLESAALPFPIPQASIDMEYAVLALRAKGVQLGWEVDCDAQLPPDFVLVRQGALSMSTVLDTMASWPAGLQGLPVLVTDIGNVEELEMALYYGVAYACGVLDREPAAGAATDPSVKHPVPPEVRRVALLLNQLVSGADTGVVVDQIKGDVGLAYRLLSRINSASYAQLASYASVEQAVMLLGRYELYRWLSMLLVQFAGNRRAASALQEMALWRSRLLELMAVDRHEVAPDQFFTLGLASVLGQLLKISQAEVVSMLNLPAVSSQALLERSGSWHAYLQMAKRLEDHTVEESAEHVALFGGAARVMELSDEAWRWAAQQTAHGDAADRG